MTVLGKRMPMDLFLRSLAEAKGDRSVTIVLSGMGTDRSLGIKDIKERLGLGIAQDLISAEHDDMPRNAVETGLVDYVLPPSMMCSRSLDISEALI